MSCLNNIIFSSERLDFQQMNVPNDVNFCIRILAQVLFPQNSTVKHPYLKGASKLRTDRC